MPGEKKKWTILGQDPDVLMAMWANVLSWMVSSFAPSFLPKLLPKCPEEDETHESVDNATRCISIGRPGGLEQLRVVSLRNQFVTIGYNCPRGKDADNSSEESSRSYADVSPGIPANCVILKNEAFSVNYADCGIRWGLYESANRFVGWPIVPGFDVAGVIEQVGGIDKEGLECANHTPTTWKPGDRVFGVTLFGAYSSRVLVPAIQLRRIPDGLSTAQAAALPAVSLTALYALLLAGYYVPGRPVTGDSATSKFNNKSILIHSAAGGVGSMLVQMSKLLGLSPIVGVVGNSGKVDEAKALGCTVVIDKSTENLWDSAEAASPKGYAAIMDANGVSTLADSYAHLAPTGRLVVFGFHSNLPMGGRGMLSPMEWIKMGRKMSKMPKFDPMLMCTDNKSVLAFNLSFFSEEKKVVSCLLDQIGEWLESGKLKCPRVLEMEMGRIGEAHKLIQSGKSVGKIVLKTGRLE